MTAPAHTTPDQAQQLLDDNRYYASSLLGKLFTAPEKLHEADPAELQDLTGHDDRIYLEALRILDQHRGGITVENLPDVVEAIATRLNTTRETVARYIHTLRADCFTTANVLNDAIGLKRTALQLSIQKAIQAGDATRIAELVNTLAELPGKYASPPTGRPSDDFTDIADLCALPPATDWLVKKYLTVDSHTLLIGEPKCGKSFVAIDLACHVATGRPWRGQRVKKGLVLYIAGEGKNGLRKRFKAWFDARGEPPHGIKLRTIPVELTNPASIAALVKIIRALPEPPILVVIDTLNRNFGPGDENSTQDMTAAVAGLDAIRNATQAAILIIHHCGLSNGNRGRGSSVLRASVDIEYAADHRNLGIQVRGLVAKDISLPPPLAWTLETQPLPWADEDGEPMDSAILRPCELPTSEPSTDKDKAPRGKYAEALDILKKLYDEQRRNLATTDHDPSQAHVTLTDWQERTTHLDKNSGNRTKIRKWLVDHRHVYVADPYVYLSAPL